MNVRVVKITKRGDRNIQIDRVDAATKHTLLLAAGENSADRLGKSRMQTLQLARTAHVACFMEIFVDQQGDEYRVRISFAYNADTWVFLARTRHAPPLTAHPTDPDALLDLVNGVRSYDVYDLVDFTSLGLTL